MKVSRKVAALFAAAAVIFSPLAAPTAGAQEIVALNPFSTPTPVTVRQGFEFYTTAPQGGFGRCTIAYNDAAKRESLTAAHCGSPGGTVYVRNDRGEVVPAGKIYPSEKFDSENLSNDWAVIKWDDNATLAPNTFSGDRIVPLSELKKGDRICVRGFSSHGTSDTADSCSTYTGSIANIFYFGSTGGQQGDSGGPVYAPGKGLVGVYSGRTTVQVGNGDWNALGRASVPADGRVVSGQEQLRFTASFFGGSISGYKINGIPIPISESSSQWLGEKPSSSEGKNLSMTNGAILGIVLSILMTVIPLIANFLR